MKPWHLQASLDEFTFRWNRRKTHGVGRISARTIEMLVSYPARTMRDIVDGARPYPLFVPADYGVPDGRGQACKTVVICVCAIM